MAAVTLKDVRLLTGGYEVTSDHNQLSLQLQQAAVEATTFGNDSMVYRPGLQSVAFTFNGYFDSGSDAINDVHAAQFGSEQVTTIVNPGGGTGYTFKQVSTELSPFGGSIGDMAAFTLSGSGVGDAFAGTVLEAGTSARSSSSASSGVQLGALSSGDTGRAGLHVIATTGSPTLDAVIESDSLVGFGSPTTRITFTQATSVGAQFATTTTATADDYWRVSWTFGGTGSITFLVTFGIA